MFHRLFVVTAAAVLLAPASGRVSGAPGQAAPQEARPAVTSQVPARGRPTRVDDEVPLFDFEAYFAGRWTFEWDVPDGALGPAGTIEGETTYRHVEGPSYQAETRATGPEGPFTLAEAITYQKDAKTVARHVTDSRGFAYHQTGTIGGDLGGYYNLYFTSAPFTYRGKTIRIRNALRLVSPVQYKHSVTVSVDGGPFGNYGSAWWKKDSSVVKSPLRR